MLSKRVLKAFELLKIAETNLGKIIREEYPLGTRLSLQKDGVTDEVVIHHQLEYYRTCVQSSITGEMYWISLFKVPVQMLFKPGEGEEDSRRDSLKL